jgi:hypothetical protein
VSPDLVDRAAAAEQNRLSAMLDAREHALGVNAAQLNPSRSGGAYGRAIEAGQLDLSTFNNRFGRTVEAPAPTSGPVRDDRFRLDRTNVPVTVSAQSSGTEIAWPQIGIGFGMGIVLALGLFLGLRLVHIRPLAH